VENVADFIHAGACAVAAGSCLVDKKAVAAKKWGVLTETAKRMIAEVKRGREE
jgi:2-dehydro-3-deoxyphosphogluconate aldolase/(4S)-4-hydroxy-2-oxoglutarate aldolase